MLRILLGTTGGQGMDGIKNGCTIELYTTYSLAENTCNNEMRENVPSLVYMGSALGSGPAHSLNLRKAGQ